LFVLAAEFVAEVSGCEDISSCELHPTSKTETAAIKNNNIFILFLTSRSSCLSKAASREPWGEKRLSFNPLIA